MKKTIAGCCVVLGGLLALSLAGCGGGGGGNASPAALATQTVSPAASVGGRATISLRWPDASATSRASRLIPLDAASVRVSFLDTNGAVLQTALLTPPSGRASGPGGGGSISTATFQDLPPGTLTVQATAFPNADGSGTAQASVTGQAVIVQNQLTTVALTMGSTITRVEILPVIVQFTGNGSTTLNAAAYDANNNLVLTNQWKWDNSNPAVINLVPRGATADISAVGVGQSVVTLTETESGFFATKTLDVTANTVLQ